jgi:restriction system protein
MSAWEQSVKDGTAAFEAASTAYRASLDRFRESADAHVSASTEAVALAARGDPTAIQRLADLSLAGQAYPSCFPREVRSVFLCEQRTLHVEYQLPDLSRVRILRPGSTQKSEPRDVSQKERHQVMDDALYAITCRSLIVLTRALRGSTVDSIHFLGWVRTIDGATGSDRDIPVCSVLAPVAQLLVVDPTRAVAQEVFRSLKGVAAPRLADYLPVRPVLPLSLTDDRFVEGRQVIDNPDVENLAMMEWEDFEHLVRELFEREFAVSGAQVRVTRASHDRGVDAIAMDPDPIRGGKYIIQAKRYTAPVDVSAVRDLYGAVQNERANRGILITTSNYGRDAYEFAKDKNLTLLDGHNLLAMLEKHGYKFRIDLKEARTTLGLSTRH